MRSDHAAHDLIGVQVQAGTPRLGVDLPAGGGFAAEGAAEVEGEGPEHGTIGGPRFGEGTRDEPGVRDAGRATSRSCDAVAALEPAARDPPRPRPGSSRGRCLAAALALTPVGRA